MIDVKQVRELIELMVEHELSEIRVREGDTAITLRKGPTGEVTVQAVGGVPATSVVPAVPVAGSDSPVPPAESAQEEGLVPIASPMVGTFYSAPDPESPPFVDVGSEVTPDTTVCIIEAMKVFNEIKAEVAGVVEQVVAHNAQAVEFGQPLMLVRLKR